MSRDPYRSSTGDLGRTGTRWDSERFTIERDRNRFGGERDRFEERETRITNAGPPPRASSRHRELSVDEVYDRRTGRGFEEDHVRERVYYNEHEEPRFARDIPVRSRRESITIEKEKERDREYYNPSPPRRAPVPPVRPGLIRRQSSLDTFDRKPLRFYEREEYGPPALRDDYRSTFVPLPRTRALPPPRPYADREYEDIKIREQDYYDDYRVVPERVREREIIRTRRRSRSKESHSRSSSSSSSSARTRSEFPKKGKTRMPSKLVSVKAIIELGYPYEVEGETIVLQKALGREHIDEVIKLSETYKSVERVEMSGGRSHGGDIVEETSKEIIVLEPPSYRPREEVVERKTTTVERRELSPPRSYVTRSRSVGRAPLIIDAERTEYVERSNNIPIGPMVLLQTDNHHHHRNSRKTDKEVQIVRREEREDGSLILYKREEVREPDTVVRIEKSKKGPNPRAVRAMLKTLT